MCHPHLFFPADALKQVSKYINDQYRMTKDTGTPSAELESVELALDTMNNAIISGMTFQNREQLCKATCKTKCMLSSIYMPLVLAFLDISVFLKTDTIA